MLANPEFRREQPLLETSHRHAIKANPKERQNIPQRRRVHRAKDQSELIGLQTNAVSKFFFKGGTSL